MDRLWTPWRYNYVSGQPSAEKERRQGVPKDLEQWPGEDSACVFCNLIQSVEWAIRSGIPVGEAEGAGFILARLSTSFVCLNAFPYSSGHVLIVPFRHLDSLAKLPPREAEELILAAQKIETILRDLYKPDGINLGMNLGEAAGAGVANHLHLHELPRWYGDTNFMTVTGETRVLPEALEVTWKRMRSAIGPDWKIAP